MSDVSQGEGWWQASDGKWYAPELYPKDWSPTTAADTTDQAPDTSGSGSSAWDPPAATDTPTVGETPQTSDWTAPSAGEAAAVGGVGAAGGVAASALGKADIDVPDVDTPSIGKASVPDLPDVDTPSIGKASIPDLPETPQVTIPDVEPVSIGKASVPDLPNTPDVDPAFIGKSSPEFPDVPDTPTIASPSVPPMPDPAMDQPTIVSSAVAPPADPTIVQPVTSQPAAWGTPQGAPSSAPTFDPPPAAPPSPPPVAPAAVAPAAAAAAPVAAESKGLSWGAPSEQQRPRVQTEPERSSNPAAGIAALLGGLLLIVGSFLAWAKGVGPLTGDINGLTGSNGVGTLICGILLLIGAGILFTGQAKPPIAAALTVAALVALGLAVYSWFDIGSLSDDLPALLEAKNRPSVNQEGVTAGLDKSIGLWLVLAGSILSLLAGIVGLAGSNKTNAQ